MVMFVCVCVHPGTNVGVRLECVLVCVWLEGVCGRAHVHDSLRVCASRDRCPVVAPASHLSAELGISGLVTVGAPPPMLSLAWGRGAGGWFWAGGLEPLPVKRR